LLAWQIADVALDAAQGNRSLPRRGLVIGDDWRCRHLRRFVHGARVAAARAALVPLAKRYEAGGTLQERRMEVDQRSGIE
jgi:hypothetical protein